MKTNRTFTVLRLLVLGLLVAGFNAKPASAQAFQENSPCPLRLAGARQRCRPATIPSRWTKITPVAGHHRPGKANRGAGSQPLCQRDQNGPFRDRHGKRRSPRGESAEIGVNFALSDA